MIKVVFHSSPKLNSWAHEMLINRRWVEALRQHGVPCEGRLAFSGVKRGTLRACVQDNGTTFEFAEPGEPSGGTVFRATHTNDDCSVFMSGEHLAKHEAEDLF